MRYLVPAMAACLAVLPAAAHAQTPSCTDRWRVLRTQLPPAERFSQKRADHFGQKCLTEGVTYPVSFGPADVRTSLTRLLTTGSLLVSRPPDDVADFCTNYATLNDPDKAEFWRRLFVAIVAREGSTNPAAVYWEQPRDRKTGRPLPDAGQYSVGLLQLSLTDRAYGCDLPEERSLVDPERNLACGVKILEKRAAGRTLGGGKGHGRDGAARYWSTLRIMSEKPIGHRANETRAPIIAATQASPHCS